MKLRYRADIDGLRAIAVLPVVFYHLGFNIFSGGYVGVDIFFVISGYLITSVILREVSANEFSILKFYERRIRRIYPALFALVAFTVLASAWLYDAKNFLDFGKSVVAATFFYSNILFWGETGYFDGSAVLKPLLHTWSLAVEEQFYIFFPLTVFLVVRFFKSKLPLIMISIAVASFAWSIYAVGQNPEDAFYLAPMRTWELLMGSVLALNIIPMQVNQSLRNGLGLVGLGLILTSVVAYSDYTLFPGLAALPPTLGAALIIYSGTNGSSWTRSVLSLSPAVFIGQISYSLYLWHWPIIVFTKYYAINPLTIGQIVIVLLTTFVISVLSWRFIETPFREINFLTRKQIFSYAILTMTVTAVIGGIIYFNDGFRSRYDANKNLNFHSKKSPWHECIRQKSAPPCPIGHNSNLPKFLVWGDSHSRALTTGIGISAEKQGVAGYLAAERGCPPLLDIVKTYKDCQMFSETVIRFIEEHTELQTIILVARWAISAEGTRYKTEFGRPVVLIDVANLESENQTNAVLFSLGLNRTVAKLLTLQRKVVIVSQVPEIGYDVPSAYFIAERSGRNANDIIDPTLNEYFDRNQVVRKTIDELVTKNPAIEVINPWKALCDQQKCLSIKDGQPLYSDDDHLSTFGSQYISYIFDALFKKLSSGKQEIP